MSYEADQISGHPGLEDFQVLQYAVDLARDEKEKQLVAANGLRSLNPKRSILGGRVALNAARAYGVSSESQLVLYEDGINFTGVASRVNYFAKLSSICIGVDEPRTIIPEDNFAEALDEEIHNLEAQAVIMAIVPVRAIRECAVELDVAVESLRPIQPAKSSSAAQWHLPDSYRFQDADGGKFGRRFL
jgi:hypothetical protein